MKRLSVPLIALVLFTFVAFHAVAQTCPTPPTGTLYNSIDWSQSQSCYYTSGNVSQDLVSCYWGSGWRFDGGWSDYAWTTFTIGANDPIANPANWNVGAFIEANSPSQNWYDQIEIDVDVRHPNGTHNYYQPFYWNGTMAALSGCANQYGFFAADHGDTVTVQLKATNLSASALRASVPRIFSNP